MQVINYYFATAAVNADSSHMTASSSASWSRFSPPSNFVNGHMSTMLFMVCHWPQSQGGDWARPHLCKLARHGPEMVHQRPCMMREMETWARWPVCTLLQQLHQKKCWNNLRDFSVKVALAVFCMKQREQANVARKTAEWHSKHTMCLWLRLVLQSAVSSDVTWQSHSMQIQLSLPIHQCI